MKALAKLLLFVACLGLIVTCSKSDLIDNDLSDVSLKSAQPGSVTLPFEANLLGEYKEVNFENQECIDNGYYCHVIVEAKGTATHMGNVSITFNFCACGGDDYSKYEGGPSELIAANGDKLFLDSGEGGTVIEGRTNEHPDYVTSYWKDKYTITGGTGRFEGASGELQMDDYNSSEDPYSHHRWYGEITFVKGKK